jgi:diguanylate cyclase (GGDEF)-like protein
MRNSGSLHGLFWYPATLVIWIALSSAALVSTDKSTAIPGIIAVAIVATLSLVLQTTGWVILVCGTALIIAGYYLYSTAGIQVSAIYAMITFSAAAIGTAIISRQTRMQITNSSLQVERDRLLIDELRINDPKTGLMRFHYARRTLTTEISRGLRYGKSLALLIIQINKWDELAEEIGLDARDNLLVAISEILFGTFRNVDTLFLNMDKIGVILPETSEEGARVVAKRLVDQISKKTHVKLFVGICCFPTDSISDDDLYRKGEHALKSAIQRGEEIYLYSQNKDAEEDFLPGILDGNDEEDFSELQLNPLGYGNERIIPQGESLIRFVGIHDLSEVEPIQKVLSSIREFEQVNLVDFHENEIMFTVKSELEDIQDLLDLKLKLLVDTISKEQNTYKVVLGSKK